MSQARLGVELTSSSWGTGSDAAAVVEVVRAPGSTGAPQAAVRRPLGVNDTPTEVALDPGEYIVRVFLPSGDVQAESVVLAAGGQRQLRFELPPSPHEWLAAAASVGVVQTLPSPAHARALEVALNQQTTTVWSTDGQLGAFPSTVPVPFPGPDDPFRTIARRQAAEDAVQEIERNTRAIDRISGRARVRKVEGWRWITRVDLRRRWPSKALSAHELALWWTGAPTRKPNKLRIDIADERNARLRAPGRVIGRIGRNDRAFVAVRDPVGGGHYAVYPEGWDSTTKSRIGEYAPPSVLLTVAVGTRATAPAAGEAAVRWRCASEIDDVEAMSLLGFLNTGQAAAGHLMLQRARDWLCEKIVNPVAAAAGAYMLLASGEEANASVSPKWRSWVRNLYRWFPELPDGAIAMAQMALAYGETGRGDAIDVEKLRGYALDAVRRGLPYLGHGVRVLTDILVALQGDDESAGRTGPAVDDTRRALSLVRQLGRITVPGEFFTVLRLDADST